MANDSSDKSGTKKAVEGSVLKRVGPAVRMIANGVPVWYLDFRYDDANGKRKCFRQKASVQTQTGAVAEGDARKAKALRCGNPDGPLDIDGAPMETAVEKPKSDAERPLVDFVEAFLDRWGTVHLSRSTRCSYLGILRRTILPTFGDVPIGKIDRAAVAAWDAELVKKGLGSKTRRNNHIVLRALLCRFEKTALLVTPEDVRDQTGRADGRAGRRDHRSGK